MSRRGAADTSMRTLADACQLNVATLYHYFPSKADLLRSVIEERGWFHLLATDEAALDPDQPLSERLVTFLTFLSSSAMAEDVPARLLLGEGLRREPTAAATVGELLGAIDAAIARWLVEGLPDLPGDPVVTGRILRHLLVGRLVERLAARGDGIPDDEAWAREVAAALLDA